MLAILQTGSLTVRELFQPESMSLNLSERDSTASFTIGPDGPDLAVGDWVQDLTEPGKGIVWRVRTVDTQHDTETRTITLEHMIASLADRILPNEVTSEDMGGTSEGVSAHTAASYVISKQSIWALGDFEYSESHPYKFDGETLKAALETITGSLEDPIWEYSFASYPFTLHIRKLSTSVGSELRAGRNISTLKYTVDRSRMYTRFYPVGKDNLRISGDYVSKNENLYGRIDKTETDQSKETEGELISWANDRLRRHAHPIVTVMISGLDLSESTGESLDQLKIGKRCQVPLPENGDLISEKVTKLAWRDKIKDPESVTVILANAMEDVQSIIRQEQAKSSSGGRAAAKADEDKVILIGDVEGGLYSAISQTSTYIMMEVVNAKSELHSSIVQTASSIRAEVNGAKSALYSAIMMTSTNIYVQVGNAKSDLYSSIEVTASSINASVASAKSALYSSIMMTSTNIYVQVGNAKSDLYSSIEVTASSISASVASAKSDLYSSIMITSTNIYTQVSNAKSDLYSNIEQTASSISASVASAKSALYSSIMITSTKIYTQVGNAKSDLYSSISQQADRIDLVVTGSGDNARIKPAAIVAAINNGASTIKLSADHIDIDGLVTSLEAVDVMVQNFNAADGEFTGDLSVLGELSAYTVGSIEGHNVSWKSANLSTPELGTYRYWLYSSSTTNLTPIGAVGYQPVTGVSTSTIYYLGHS